jgi:hypothetical protein
MGRRLGPGPSQRRCLGPAARLGHGFGVGREQDGEPQPRPDLDLEAEAGRPGGPREAGRLRDRAKGHERRGQLDDEHDGVLDEQARVELPERVRDGRAEKRRVEDAARAWRLAGWLGTAERDEALEPARAAGQFDA